MSIDAAVQALASGLVVGVPTDTVYGLAADPNDKRAVASLFELKGRATKAPLVVLAATIEAVDRLVDVPETARPTLEAHWPGALTAVLRMSRPLAEGVGDGATLAVRVPDQRELLAVLDRYGPLAVTSANVSGEAPARSAAQAAEVFGDRVTVYVEGSSGSGLASTVADFTVDPPRILRQGDVKL